MFFFNLTFVQFLALFGTISAGVIALYLLDRSRRKQRVATLRFWIAAEQLTAVTSRRKIQQPISLILQLISICLLLLAIAQLRLGSRAATPFDHVLVLETSAWMAAQAGGGRMLMDEARARAGAYLRSVPPGDRVMLVRADALATPATAFEANLKKLEQAIAESEPGATALNLEQALEFARRIQRLSAARAGEIMFIGSGRVSERESASLSAENASNIRISPITAPVENTGLKRIGLRRSAADPAVWEIFVSVRNYGAKPRTVNLGLQVGGAPAGSQAIVLPPGAEKEALFEHRTRAAGLLEVRLFTRDAFPYDDRAVVELPEQKTVSVAVYSDDPQALRPMLEANPLVRAAFRSTRDYSAAHAADLVILDRFRPPAAPAVNTIWIDPPAGGSPIPVRSAASRVRLTRWHSENSLGEGLRSKDLNLETASVLEAAPGDLKVAEVDAGPVIVARPGKAKTLVIGFHPGQPSLRYELSTPLLFANALRWMAPEIFVRRELVAGSVGAVGASLGSEVKPADVKVLQEDGRPLPFTLRNKNLHFFSGAPGIVRVLAGDQELVYSLALPELAEAQWEPPPGVRKGIPAARQGAAGAMDLWQALACLGMAGLLIDWVYFGRMRRTAMKEQPRVESSESFPARLRRGMRLAVGRKP